MSLFFISRKFKEAVSTADVNPFDLREGICRIIWERYGSGCGHLVVLQTLSYG
jgi:hypothetical protein